MQRPVSSIQELDGGGSVSAGEYYEGVGCSRALNTKECELLKQTYMSYNSRRKLGVWLLIKSMQISSTLGKSERINKSVSHHAKGTLICYRGYVTRYFVAFPHAFIVIYCSKECRGHLLCEPSYVWLFMDHLVCATKYVQSNNWL